MDIAWIGHAAFRLRGRDVAVVTDPCPASTGFHLNRPQADVVTVSNSAPGYAWVEGVAGSPRKLDAPGEFEIRNILLTGVPTSLPQRQGATGGRNLAFVIKIDDVVIAHLGDLGALPGAAQIEELSQVHVVLIPIGGREHMDAPLAAQIISALEPRLVIPMLYRVGPETEPLDNLDPFLKEMGAEKPATVENHINVTPSSLPEHTAVHVLAPRGD